MRFEGFRQAGARRAPPPLDYPRLVATLAATQAATRAAATADARPAATLGVAAAITELFSGGPRWADAAERLGHAFHPGVAMAAASRRAS